MKHQKFDYKYGANTVQHLRRNPVLLPKQPGLKQTNNALSYFGAMVTSGSMYKSK